MMRNKREKGFTLIELLLVVAIIGILAAVAVPAYRPNQDNARIAKVRANLESIETAAELYKNEKAGYPAKVIGATGDTTGFLYLTGAGANNWLKRAPVLPVTVKSGNVITWAVDAITGVASVGLGAVPATTVTLDSTDTDIKTFLTSVQ